MKTALLPGIYDTDRAATFDLPELPDLSRFAKVTIDCETNGLSWVTGDRPIGFAVRLPEARQSFYVPVAHATGNYDPGLVKRWMQEQFKGKQIRNLNTRFDLHMTRVWGVDLRQHGNTFRDVAHMAALLDDHRTSFSLESLAEAELGRGKLDVAPKAHLAELPSWDVADYALRDVELVDDLIDVYTPRIAYESLGPVLDIEDRIIPVVVEMESHGLPLDMPRLARWTAIVDGIVKVVSRELDAAAGFACNPDKKDHLARLFNRARIPFDRTPTGQPSFPGPVVKAAGEKDEAIRLAYRLGKLKDFQSKVLVPFQKNQVGGTLFPSFHQLRTDEAGTVSGRFASSKPNAQNLPNADKYHQAYGWLSDYHQGEKLLARALVVPERGVWVNADQKQVEPRIALSYAAMLGLPGADAWVTRYQTDPRTNFHQTVDGLIRQAVPDFSGTYTQVKIGGLQLMYGGTENSLVRTLGMEPDDAGRFIEGYDKGFPMMSQLLSRARYRAEDVGYVRTKLGRRSRFLGSKGRRERTHKALNCVIQGTQSDDAKLALIAVYEQRKALGFTMRLTEHDALGGDLEGPLVPLENLLNEQRLGLPIPILWDAKTGANWAEAKG